MLLGFLPEGDATCRSAAGAGAAVDLDQMTLDKRVIIKVITGVVWGDDISQLLLLLRNGLLLAGVSLLEFIHHGNYTVETFGHAGPHPVLKEQNTPSATPISRTDYISGCLAVFKTAKYSRGEGVRQTEGKPCEAAKKSPRVWKQKGVSLLSRRWLHVQKVNRKLLSGYSEIILKSVWTVSSSPFFCFLSAIC